VLSLKHLYTCVYDAWSILYTITLLLYVKNWPPLFTPCYLFHIAILIYAKAPVNKIFALLLGTGLYIVYYSHFIYVRYAEYVGPIIFQAHEIRKLELL